MLDRRTASAFIALTWFVGGACAQQTVSARSRRRRPLLSPRPKRRHVRGDCQRRSHRQRQLAGSRDRRAAPSRRLGGVRCGEETRLLRGAGS